MRLVNVKNEAFARLRRNLEPAAIANQIADALQRAPLTTLALAITGCCAIIFSVAGYSSVAGMAIWLAIPVAVVALFLQIVFKQKASFRSWAGISMAGLFSVLSLLNICFVAAGLLALTPDSFGASTASSQVQTQDAIVAKSVGELTHLAQVVVSAKEYSVARSDDEIGEQQPYRRTCPGSSGPGEGPIHDLRKQDAQMFSAISERTDKAASDANTALAAIRKTIAGYSAKQHKTAMAALENDVRAARDALLAARVPETLTTLKLRHAQIQTGVEVGRYGLVSCPDPQLTQLIDAIITIDDGRGSRIERAPPPEIQDFVSGPEPTERDAFFGLVDAIAAWWNSQPVDFKPYRHGLIGGPVIDIALFSLLSILLRELRRRKSLAVQLAERIDANIPPHDLAAARAQAHRHPEYALVLDRLHKVLLYRFMTVTLLVVPKYGNDIERDLLGRARDWARLGMLSRERALDRSDLPFGHSGWAVPLQGDILCFTVLDDQFLDHLIDDLTIEIAHQSVRGGPRTAPPPCNDEDTAFVGEV